MVTDTKKTHEQKIDIGRLVPAEYNPRQMTEEEFVGLKESIRLYSDQIANWNSTEGYRLAESATVNIQGFRIVGGHQRIRALSALGQDWIHADDISWVDIEPSSALEKSLCLSLNNPNIQGNFTSDLDSLLDDIKLDFDSFDSILLNELQDPDAQIDDSVEASFDDAPGKPINPICQYGDIWKLGDHVLMCANSECPDYFKNLLCDNPVDLVFTDPPYNMNYKSEKLGGIKNDHLSDRDFAELILSTSKNMLNHLRPGGSYYICMSAIESSMLAHRLNLLGLKSRPIIWAKPGMGLGAQEYRPQYEVIMYGYLGKSAARVWNGSRGNSDLWEFNIERQVLTRKENDKTIIVIGLGEDFIEIELDGEANGMVYHASGESSDLWRCSRHSTSVYDHPTQKPVALIERAILNSSKEGDTVLDYFAGSGSTLIACEKTKRKCFAMELDPKYCDVILKRWVKLTGQDAVRVGDDKSFKTMLDKNNS